MYKYVVFYHFRDHNGSGYGSVIERLDTELSDIELLEYIKEKHHYIDMTLDSVTRI